LRSANYGLVNRCLGFGSIFLGLMLHPTLNTLMYKG